jgi:zinc transport system substrate-binding protein
MNLRKSIVIAVLILAAFCILWLRFDKPEMEKFDGTKTSVAATYYPLYDIARNIAGDKANVVNLTPPGAEPHDYEPAPNTLIKAKNADVFVYNGGNFEPWVDSFLGSYRHTAVKASEGITLRSGKDPHFWLDPAQAKHIAENIRDGLAKADPAFNDYYAQRAETYIKKLDALDAEFKKGLANCRQDTVISSHDAFSYLADRYGFKLEAIAGINPEEEPSAARLAELSRLVRDKDIQYVFFESLVSPRLADTIAQETGAQTLVFDPIEGLTNDDQKQGKDYLSVQRENLRGLRAALACK